jgi:hypothetical protein
LQKGDFGRKPEEMAGRKDRIMRVNKIKVYFIYMYENSGVEFKYGIFDTL